MRRSSDGHCARLRAAALLACLAVLAACATQPQSTGPDRGEGPAEVTSASELPRYSDTWRDAFLAVEASLAGGDWMSAATQLAAIPAAQLQRRDGFQYTLLQLRQQRVRGAISELPGASAQLMSLATDPDQVLQAAALRRQILRDSRQHLASARLGDSILAAAPEQAQAALQQSIWQDLQRVSIAELDAAASSAANNRWRGWIELAQLDASHGDNVPALLVTLAEWQAKYPQHPAQASLPGGLDRLSLQQSSGTVVLLLPFSGPLAEAGKAVRDGYVAALYAARSRGYGNWAVQLQDSHQGSMASHYARASAAGADLLIGPLRKDRVAELAAVAQRDVPVLALNRVDLPVLQPPVDTAVAAAAVDLAAAERSAPSVEPEADMPDAQAEPVSPPPLLQLSLTPEDEARQLAADAYARGYRRALLLHPAGAWGDTMQTALAQSWQELGGVIVSAGQFTDARAYSAEVSAALGVSTSQQRAREVADLLGEEVEARPRRRQDVDVVFMLARSAADARSLKPLLAFHYAGQVPVFANSDVYSAPGRRGDRDLNGTQLLQMPWVIFANQGLAAAMQSSGSRARLNALGADAWLLQSRLQQLLAPEPVCLRGSTGLLQPNSAGQVERELQWALIDEGKLRPLP